MQHKGPNPTKSASAKPVPRRKRNSSRVTTQRRPRTTELEGEQTAANGFIVRHYPIGCLGGAPRWLSLSSADLWIFPVLLTSPGYGVVGEVGLVAIDARTGQVLAGTPRDEVRAAIQRLKQEKHGDLEAAFLRTRTG